jgi:hypothetical protein
MTGVAFELGELGLKRLDLTRLKHLGVVVDTTAQLRHIECDGNGRKQQQEDN